MTEHPQSQTGGGTAAPPDLSPSHYQQQQKHSDRSNTHHRGSIFGGNPHYRRAILQAIENLHDYHYSSNLDLIRKRTHSILTEDCGRSCSAATEWNDAVFLKTLKSLQQAGEIDLQAKLLAALSPEYKKKRADSVTARLEEGGALLSKQQQMQQLQQQQQIFMPVLLSPSSTQQQQQSLLLLPSQDGATTTTLPPPPPLQPLQQQFQTAPPPPPVLQQPPHVVAPAAVQGQHGHHHHHAATASKGAPHRKPEHEKWKIVPKAIHDKTIIVNPMDTH